MPMGRVSSGSGSVPPAPRLSFPISEGKALHCVAGAVFAGQGCPCWVSHLGTPGDFVPVSSKAAVPSSADLGASAASPDSETWDDFGYGERLAMVVQIRGLNYNKLPFLLLFLWLYLLPGGRAADTLSELKPFRTCWAAAMKINHFNAC